VSQPPRIMIVSGEASGDLHGARLVEAIKHLHPDIYVCGMGGVELRRQGVDILYDAAKMAVVGIIEVIAHLKDIRNAQNILFNDLVNTRPQLLILIDYPDFNLILAKKAKKLGIPVFYYISPQVWAWRSGRVKTIRRIVDKMAVILPFEKQFYKDRGVDVEYVGHPLMDSVRTSLSRQEFREKHSIKENSVVVGILPGSRKKEIRTMLPLFLKAATILKKKHSHITFLLPQASSINREDLDSGGLADSSVTVKVITEDRYNLMAACDLVMAASGTVTLELAILNIPMVVSYRMSSLTYLLGRKLIKVDYASLVNLVAGKEVVPELLQENATPEKIALALEKIWPGHLERETMLAGISSVRERLGHGGASKKAAQVALETMGL
jgi:lipid-A-disaccharide synthase